MTANQLTLWYLVASVCFILALKGLSSPTTARRGNYFGIAGMTIAVLTTVADFWFKKLSHNTQNSCISAV